MTDQRPAEKVDDASRFTNISMHRHSGGVTADTCDICTSAVVHAHVFNQDACVCDHEDYQHSFIGCVVGPETARCPCPASYRCER